MSGLKFRDSTLDHFNLLLGGCAATITASNLTSFGISSGSNSVLIADQIHMQTASAFSYLQDQVGITTQVTNSVLEDVSISNLVDSSSSPASHFVFAYDTVVFTAQGGQLDCSPPAGGALHFEDSVLVALAPPTSQPSVVTGLACSLLHNVLFPQPSGFANNIVADPQFVNTAGSDFHLKPASPAVDAAIPSTGLTSDHDLDGTPRPRGAAPDIGAYELKL